MLIAKPTAFVCICEIGRQHHNKNKDLAKKPKRKRVNLAILHLYICNHIMWGGPLCPVANRAKVSEETELYVYNNIRFRDLLFVVFLCVLSSCPSWFVIFLGLKPTYLQRHAHPNDSCPHLSFVSSHLESSLSFNPSSSASLFQLGLCFLCVLGNHPRCGDLWLVMH